MHCWIWTLENWRACKISLNDNACANILKQCLSCGRQKMDTNFGSYSQAVTSGVDRGARFDIERESGWLANPTTYLPCHAQVATRNIQRETASTWALEAKLSEIGTLFCALPGGQNIFCHKEIAGSCFCVSVSFGQWTLCRDQSTEFGPKKWTKRALEGHHWFSRSKIMIWMYLKQEAQCGKWSSTLERTS